MLRDSGKCELFLHPVLQTSTGAVKTCECSHNLVPTGSCSLSYHTLPLVTVSNHTRTAAPPAPELSTLGLLLSGTHFPPLCLANFCSLHLYTFSWERPFPSPQFMLSILLFSLLTLPLCLHCGQVMGGYVLYVSVCWFNALLLCSMANKKRAETTSIFSFPAYLEPSMGLGTQQTFNEYLSSE